jgi:hypothetical protein
MLDHEEARRVKARFDVTQFYQRRKDVSRREMPRGVMTISGDPNPNNSSSSLYDDIEDDTYVPSPWARPYGKGLASASGSRAARDDESEEEAEEGADVDDGEEEEEVSDVEEINPPNYVDMGPLVFRAPTNPTLRVKVSYKGKTESVREIEGSLLTLNLEMPMTIDFTPFSARFLWASNHDQEQTSCKFSVDWLGLHGE